MHIWKLFRGLPQLPSFSPEDGGGGGLDNVSDYGADLADLGGDVLENEDLEDESEEKDKEKGKPKDESEEDESEDEEEGDDEKEEKPKGKGKGKENEEEEEPEEEEEDENKEENEDDKPVEGRPTIKQLKAAGVLKKFPELREIYFREQKFSEHFNSVDEAAEASTKAQYYDEIEESVIKGDPKIFLSNLHEGNPKAFKGYVRGIIDTVKSLSPDDHLAMIEPVIKDLLFHAHKYGERMSGTEEGKNLMKSAKWITNFVFANGGEIPDLTKKAEKHPAELELERVQKESADREYKTASSYINSKIDQQVVGFLNSGLTNVQLSKMEKEYIVGKALDELLPKLSEDKNHGIKMRALWKRAQTSGYAPTAKEAIILAQVARAKPLLRDIRDRLIQDALKGKRPGSKKTQEEDLRPKKRNFDTSGRGGGSPRRPGSVLDSSKIDYNRTTDKDILFDNGGDLIKLKGRK